MKTESRVGEKIDLIASDSEVGSEYLLGFVEQDCCLPRFTVNFGGICPTPVKGIGYKGPSSRVKRGFALELVCD